MKDGVLHPPALEQEGLAGALQVCADGTGFDPLTARNAGGVGLRSFEERAAQVGGK